MKNKLILILIVLSIVSCTSNKIIAQKKYKGGTKHKQPEIESLPKETEYIFDKKLNETLEIKLNQKVDELFSKHNIAGITATILIPKKGIWEINRGYISKPDNKVIDSSSVFFWASVGKLITSTIIHQLVLEGRLSFDDKLSNWFPDIEYSKKITINQLLNHTNGIYSFNYDPASRADKSFTTEEFLEISKSHNNMFKPGEYWSYTNTGYLLLSLIIEKIESKTFGQVVQDKISKPLHLKTLKVATKNEPNLALAHSKDSVIRKDYSIILGAGGFYSNSKDMAIFLSDLLTGKIIPLINVHNMMKDLYPMFGSNSEYYGKGIMLYDFKTVDKTDNVWIGHSGGTENYKAILLYDTKSKIIMAISINENIPAQAVAYKLMELINK